MNEQKISLTIGALLHDIGKVVYRAGVYTENHSQSGREYLTDRVKIENKDILDCVRYHHAREMKNANIDENSPAYIVYIADNIASAADRRDIDEGEKGFDKNLPLSSVFNLLNNNTKKGAYSPHKTNVEEYINFPVESAKNFELGDYQKILADITNNLRSMEFTTYYIHSLLDALEANLLFVPSSTDKKQAADISLFNHLKLTAAFAAAIMDYLAETEEKDYKQILFANEKEFYDKKAFLLTTLDLSGIQKFIYTINSEGALKNLRARSFYLDFIAEHIAGRLLSDLSLTRANLLYIGGGRADLILPNTKATRDILQNFRKRVNKWFQKHFDIALFLAIGFAEASTNDFKNEPDGSYAGLRRALSESIAKNKTQRYTAEEIIALNEKSGDENTRECNICKTSDNLTEDKLCAVCAALTNISADIVNEKYDFVASVIGDNKSLPPLPDGYNLIMCDENEARRYQQTEGAYIYGKNRFFKDKNIATRLWIGDYHTGGTFEELAKQSTGIKRLGVLRADVDNLGAAFAAGFRRKNGDNRFVTLSRTAELSRQLSLFFKLHIKKILNNPEFTMTGINKEKHRAAVVYSGGDDLFIVGAWDDVIELAVDIRKNFAKFTEDALTISAGIGIYNPSYPISVMADEVAALEECSKNYPDKNAVTLPSEGKKHKIKISAGKEAEIDEGSYGWEILEKKVIGEKLAALCAFFGKPQEAAKDATERGKNFLYNLLELLRGQSEKIHFARYIYLLSRMEPDKDASPEEKERYGEFSEKMYRWYQDKEDTRELKTAILLYVYLTRETEEKENDKR